MAALATLTVLASCAAAGKAPVAVSAEFDTGAALQGEVLGWMGGEQASWCLRCSCRCTQRVWPGRPPRSRICYTLTPTGNIEVLGVEELPAGDGPETAGGEGQAPGAAYEITLQHRHDPYSPNDERENYQCAAGRGRMVSLCGPAPGPVVVAAQPPALTPPCLPSPPRWFYFRLSNAANTSVTLRIVDVNNATAGGGSNANIPGGCLGGRPGTGTSLPTMQRGAPAAEPHPPHHVILHRHPPQVSPTPRARGTATIL